MSKLHLSIFGLGAGGLDDISIGTLRELKALNRESCPLLLRTARHPTVAALAAEGIVFAGSFDEIYDHAETFENVYSAIAASVVDTVRTEGGAAFLVPGHPLIGEKTVQLLLTNQAEFDISIHAASSFIEACLAAAKLEVTGLVILDALSLSDPTDQFRKFASPYSPSLPHLIYQVYDNDIASRVKLSLLERYPPDFVVSIISRAGVHGKEYVSEVPLYQLDHAANSFDHLTTVLIPVMTSEVAPTEMTDLLDIMARLRHPTTGCPWDREQTPEALKRYAIEEVYEVLDAIDDGDIDKYVEELGDLLLQVAFHAQLAREAGEFSIEDVVASISEKLIRRHPHVFGSVVVGDSAEVLANWEVIKRAEKGNLDRKSRLDGIPRHLPALSQAMEISKRAAKSGFEWQSINGVFDKLEEEVSELKEALGEGNQRHIAGELGDLLFTVVNLARFAKIDAEDALRVMVKRFSNRFRIMEQASEQPLEELDSDTFEELWQMAKREESNSS